MLGRDWYHVIEIEPGLWTKGRGYPNIGLTRDALRRCSVEGASCLDVGTMDGLIALLLERRRARRVIACDRYDRREMIEFVQQKLDSKFLYLSRVTLADVREIAPKLLDEPFDLIAFSGVLYHMYDPMVGLALVRSMLRTGGIAVIETTAVKSAPMISYFNVEQDDPHNYWNMSVGMLDYLLRMFKLKPLDCRYFGGSRWQPHDGAQYLRVCVPCEAVDERLGEADDAFMSFARDDAYWFPQWSSKKPNTPLSYAPHAALPKRRSGAIDLFAAVNASEPFQITEACSRLALNDVV